MPKHIIKPKWKKNNDILRAVSLLGQLGLVMVLSILIFVLFGVWIDKTFGLGGIGVGIGAILGILCGGLVDFKLLKKHL